MLQYVLSEDSKSSHFVIRKDEENIYLLGFENPSIEEHDFNQEFLQNNSFEMKIAKVSIDNINNCARELAETVKHIFDTILLDRDNCVIFISIESKSNKNKLVKSFIENDDHVEFKYLIVEADGVMFYFFYNEKKTSSIEVFRALADYFRREYEINLILV